MKARHILTGVALLLSISCTALADRVLNRTEILQVFQRLTSQPRKTWIAAGTIEATREEYRAPRITDMNEINNQIRQRVQEYQNNPDKRELTENLQKMTLDAMPFNIRYELANQYTMNSTVTVRFDGNKFYWEIDVQSRTDSVNPGADLAGNFMTDQFNLDWNARRIFAWDGQNYTTYVLPVNHATVDSTESTPHVVNGPLTAGFIPWGYGYYTYDNLCSMNSSAVEKDIDGQTQIYLTLNNSSGLEMLFVIDPAKDYAVVSCTTSRPSGSVTSKTYSNYRLVAGNWIPTTILLERNEAASNRLLARDLWEFIGIDANVPEADSFNVGYQPDALIEYYSNATDRPLMYRHSDIIDTDLLLAERLAIAANEGVQSQNCATIALDYAVSQLGKDLTDEQLAQLISEPDKTTSLFAMKQLAQDLGFHCRAVTTDIQALKNLTDCAVILHIPGKDHFVVLADIDDDYVRIIDLASNKFYYRTNIGFFGMDWTEGVALVLSNQAIQLQGESTDIGELQLHNILGASGWSCTLLFQTFNVIFCDYVGGECLGDFRIYWQRYGCEAAESGSCSMGVFERCRKAPCIEDPYYPWGCAIAEWTFYYMRACG